MRAGERTSNTANVVATDIALHRWLQKRNLAAIVLEAVEEDSVGGAQVAEGPGHHGRLLPPTNRESGEERYPGTRVLCVLYEYPIFYSSPITQIVKSIISEYLNYWPFDMKNSDIPTG